MHMHAYKYILIRSSLDLLHSDFLLVAMVHLIPLARLDHLPENVQPTDKLTIEGDLGESWTSSVPA